MLNTALYILGAAVLAIVFSSALPQPLTIHNYNYDLSDNVEIFNNIPQRVITTNGSATETLLALGLEKNMIGTAYLDNPPMEELQAAYDRIPVISRMYPGKEQVLALEPDLIVGWHSVFAPQNLGDTSYWNRLGVATFILRDSSPLPSRISNVYDDLRDLGLIFQVEERAASFINDIDSELQAMAELTGARDKSLRVLILENMSGGRMRAWGDDSTPGQMLITIGAVNVFSRTGDQNRESIVAANPDAVIIIYMDSVLEESELLLNSFFTDPILKYTQASKDRRIGLVPLSETYCPGVRIIDGLKHMSNILFA
ncbi:MAG: ABC transporter substrate-binding protein [Deltaproteobacteria bacterium]|jgi:iron complex transport system substrate-binding protein|nr:ABC transporter substrate-binding protein [Deltaproteobacteria bacterium]